MLSSPLWEAGFLVLTKATNAFSQPMIASSALVTSLPIGTYPASRFPKTRLQDGYTWHAYKISQDGKPMLKLWVAQQTVSDWLAELPPKTPETISIFLSNGFGLTLPYALATELYKALKTQVA